MSQKNSRRPCFDLRLHWRGVSSQNMQHLRWSAVEVGGLGSFWVLSRGSPHQGQERPPENLFCSVGVEVNCWPCGCHELSGSQWPNGARVSKKALSSSNATGNIFTNLPQSWETLAPSPRFLCFQQNQPGAQVIIRMGPVRGVENGGKRDRCSPVVAL